MTRRRRLYSVPTPKIAHADPLCGPEDKPFVQSEKVYSLER